MSKSVTIINLNTRVFLNKNKSYLGTVCNVIVKINKNKTETLFYNVCWDNKIAADNNTEYEYTAKQITPIQIQVVAPIPVVISEQTELRYQQYVEECRLRVVAHAEQERVKTAKLQLQQQQYAHYRLTKQASSNNLNRVHNRISDSEMNYATSNTAIPKNSVAQSPQIDDGSFINQDAIKYEVKMFFV
jgi:hypothetical protein